MKELNFTKDELKKLIKNKYIASGSEASIYEYNDNIAIRLYDVEENIYCDLTCHCIDYTTAWVQIPAE